MVFLSAVIGDNPPALAADKLSVVATTSMVADAARQIGGDHVAVRALMGSGIDPHSYRQTRTDIVALTRADLVLWHGLNLEAQMETFLLALGKKRRVVAVADGLDKRLLRAHDTHPGKFDPHVWMDPRLWAKVVTTVRDALSAARPASRALFEANAERHLTEIGQLSDRASAALATVSASARVLVTAHDAFGYFGRAYGFEVAGIQGISTDSEAGLKRIGELVNLLVTRKIRAVFVESTVSDRNIRALIEGAASRGHQVAIGGELYSDAMGAEGTYKGTYIGMIDHNVTTVTRALGGTVKPGGLTGRLAPRS